MDKFLSKHGADYLPLAERARLGCLPDTLELWQLCQLVYPGKAPIAKARALAKTLKDAIAADKLKARVREEQRITGRTYYSPWVEGWDRPPDIRHTTVRLVMLDRTDFRAYVEAEGLPPGELTEVLRRWVFPEAPAEAQPTPKPTATDRPRTRQDNLTIAIKAALPALRDRLKRDPSPDELFDFLKQHDATEGTGVICDTKDAILIWKDAAGNPHEVSLKSLGRRLKRLL